jgi:4-hydroxy-4-methyl-2-oxoglutarate aldolase
MADPRFVIRSDFPRPDPSWAERAARLHGCLIGGLVGPRQVMDPGIQVLHRTVDPPWRACGPAFTVRPEHPDDLLMGQIAGKYVKPGDVVVIDAVGARMAAWGASMAHGVKQAGAVGVVIDGYVLTADLLRTREDIPIFCRGTVSISGEGRYGGWINAPVVCGGVIVHPGDLIVADADGVAVIPQARIPEVIAAVEARNTPRPPDGTVIPRKPDAPLLYKRSGAEEKIAKLVGDGAMTIL